MTRILVVDDVPSNVTVLTWMLMHQGYTVSSALSGPQALEMIAAERPDVVLLDISMPEMSGIEVCRRLKTDPQLRLIPIILVTARTRDEDMVEGLNAGADDYITKPVTREILSARLRSALRIKTSTTSWLTATSACAERWPSGPRPRRSCATPRSWSWWGNWPAASPTSSTTCCRRSKAMRRMPWKVFRPRRDGTRICSRC